MNQPLNYKEDFSDKESLKADTQTEKWDKASFQFKDVIRQEWKGLS